MSTRKSSLETVARHLALAVQPLRSAFSDSDQFKSFMYRLGWDISSLPDEYKNLTSLVDDIFNELNSLGDDPDPAVILRLLDKVRTLYVAIKNISQVPLGVAASDQVAFLSELKERVFELLLIDYLSLELPKLYQIFQLLGVIEIESHPEVALRPAYLRTALRLNKISEIISNPLSVPEIIYGWGTNDLNFRLLSRHLDELFASLGFLSEIVEPDGGVAFGYGNPEQDSSFPHTALKIPIFYTQIADLPIEVAFEILDLPQEGSKLPGIVIQPVIPSDIGLSFPISENLEFKIRAESEIARLFGLLIRPDGVSVRYPFEPGAELPDAGFGVSLDFKSDEPALLLGSPGATRLQLEAASIRFVVNHISGELEANLGADLKGLAIILSMKESDGFLSSLLGDGERKIDLLLDIGWSSRTGLGFSGGAGFESSFNTHRQFGPLSIQQVQIGLRTTLEAGKPPDLITEIGVSLGGQLGPVAFSVEGIGLRLVAVFEDGNAGPFDFAVGFKPPTGAGLSIDAQVVVGGGYLSFDPHKQEYSGILQLEIADKISVNAIGLLMTQMPDGRSGFSLVAIIFAEGFAPIQLGFGFTLTGIGGLMAINRTFDETVLRAGLKNHALDSVMFPNDPIRNAPQILSNLNRVFPPSRGNHLFGPMLQIVWGTPPLITANLALVFEIGARRRLLILAQIAAILPRPENDLVRLQMDAVGVLDFDQGVAALDAALHDSRLLKKFTLTGEMAMRLNWQGSPNFALAVGGLHPAFNPPPAFPKLQRIAINLSSGDNPRFRCEAYFALTSNTVQFGARAELFASAAGFSIQGEVGFDVLIQFDPFFFLAEFHAQLQLKRGSSNLFKVRLEGSLAGPRPLHIKGKATFEILWWDVSIRVDKTLVEGVKPPPPEPMAVLPQLMDALGNPGNWVTQLPGGQRQLVTLRPSTPAPTEVFLHPLGSLTVKQNVVPLDIDISKFGQAAPSGARRFTITSVTVGGNVETKDPVRDFFAPAQFFEMSDDEKLSRPSFELMSAGVGIASKEIAFTGDTSDLLEVKAIEFETLMIGKDVVQPQPGGDEPGKKLYTLSAALLEKQSRFGAAANSEVRRTGNAKYRTSIVKHRIAKEGWRIVATDDLSVQAAAGIEPGTVMNYSEAEEALRTLKQREPARAGILKILRLSELS